MMFTYVGISTIYICSQPVAKQSFTVSPAQLCATAPYAMKQMQDVA